MLLSTAVLGVCSTIVLSCHKLLSGISGKLLRNGIRFVLLEDGLLDVMVIGDPTTR